MQNLRMVFVGGLIGAGAVAIATALSAAQGGVSPQAINLPGRTTTALFSDAVLVGDTLYLSGRLGLEGGEVPATPEQEVHNVLDDMQRVLSEANMTMDDLVQVQVFCSDVAFYGIFNEVYLTYFGNSPPARAFIGSGNLLFDARFEVMGVAVRN
jgi:2-iminobutanoate/2-iminopropanoate deaminase